MAGGGQGMGREGSDCCAPVGRLLGPGWADMAAGLWKGPCKPGVVGEDQEDCRRHLVCHTLLGGC